MFMLLVLIMSTVINAIIARAQSDIFNTTCSPFRLLVIWHTSNGEDYAFIEQKRLIIQLLLNIPQGTEIHVTAINTQRYHLLHFKKNQTTDWIYNISMYNPESLENHAITDSLIKGTVFSFRKQNDKREVAELTVLIVSEKTLAENSLETIKKIKRCVVFTGLNPPPPFWTSLATDRQHVVKLNTTSESLVENIDGTANKVLDLLCRDSRLICDTDEFWTGIRCVNCSYICSADTKQHPDICLDVCPYYKRLSLKKADNEADKNVTSESGKPNSDRIFISLLLLLSVLTTVASAAACVLLRRVRMLMQHSPAYLGRKHVDQETELDCVAETWNSHLIRDSTRGTSPSARPNILYTIPELYGTRDFLTPKTPEQIEICRDLVSLRETVPCDVDIYNWCVSYMSEQNMSLEYDPYDAVNFCVLLRQSIKEML